MGNKGQSTIEFIVTFAFTLGMVLIFLQLGISFMVGFLVHHTTFKAARSYYVLDANGREYESSRVFAEQAGTKIFNDSKLEAAFKFSLIPAAPGFNIKSRAETYSPNRQDDLYTGVRYNFKQKISMFSLFGSKLMANFVSEAYLGKEPTRGECYRTICDGMKKKMESMGVSGLADGIVCEDSSSGNWATPYDNGC